MVCQTARRCFSILGAGPLQIHTIPSLLSMLGMIAARYKSMKVGTAVPDARTSGGIGQLLVSDDDGMLGEEGDLGHVPGPDDVLDIRRAQLRERCALLHIK